MSNQQNPTIEIPTDEEINRIDSVLNKLDELMKQLPEDYQQDYAQEVLDRFEEE